MWQALYPKARYPQGHPDLATSLTNLGLLLKERGEYARAEPFFRDALAMSRALYPQDKFPHGHPHLARSLNNLGGLLRARGEYARAEPLCREALAMCRALYPQDKYPHGHPDLAAGLNDLGRLLSDRGEHALAEPLFRQALGMHQGLAGLFADAASETQALNYAAQFPLARDGFLSLPHHLLKTPPDAVYAPVWRGKGALSRLLGRRQQALLAATDPDTRQRARELLLTRRQLARLLLAPAGATPDQARRVQELTAAKEELERQLAGRLPGAFLDPDRDPATPADLLRRLPERAAFVDLLRYDRFEQDPEVPGQKGERRTRSYTAFVLARGKLPQRVELGPAKPIEDALAGWRQAIADWKPDLEAGARSRTERKAAFAAGELRRLVWEPLARHLPPDTRTVYLSPDGDLTRLPWAALPGRQNGTVLLEEVALAVVPHGPFLLQSLTTPAAKPDPKVDVLLLVGGVAYGRPPDPGETAPEELRTLRSAPRGPGGRRWPDLAGAEAEVDRIAGMAAGRHRRELRGARAGTARVLAELPKARWAHFATHGFFADPSFRSAFQLDEKQFAYRGEGYRVTPGARNPLVLSGLVLAGANLPPGPGQDPLTDDHGILTAEVLAGLDLRRLELAVLSACETGLGDVAGGEGAFGLQRAFHLAGTRDVVASLWKVDDRATAALMALFYHHLWREGRPPLEALRQAQLALYRQPGRIPEWAEGRSFQSDKTGKLPKDPQPAAAGPGGKAPVKVWAAFVLSGPGR
jgi:CHAT domain-containing protein